MEGLLLDEGADLCLAYLEAQSYTPCIQIFTECFYVPNTTLDAGKRAEQSSLEVSAVMELKIEWGRQTANK